MRFNGLGLAILLRQSRRQQRSFRYAPPNGGFVYVIKGEHGAVKIGSSVDPDRRLAELQTGSPYRLWIDYRIAVSGRADAVEFAAHGILDQHRGLGEWFSVPTEAAIAAIHAAAFRLGVSLNWEPAAKANWKGRLVGAAWLATPFWLLLALGHPVLAGAWMVLALAWFVVRVLQRGPVGGVLPWLGVALGGAALPMIPAAVLSNVASALWP